MIRFAIPRRSTRAVVVVIVATTALLTHLCSAADESATAPFDSNAAASPNHHELPWGHDYAAAKEHARTQERMLIIFFDGGPRHAPSVELAARLNEPTVAERLATFERVRLPLDTTIDVAGSDTILLRHPSFTEMQGLPGLAIIDFMHADAPFFGTVVSTFPMLRDNPYTVEQLRVILDLPAGTLTQRTLIYAVQTHPEKPRSASGTFDSRLADEATAHSAYQARIRRQGHHQWETRFHLINRLLPGNLLASEVCAESWPGQGLLESALDCVRCWRYSSGHWNAVRAAHPVFGYDMRRGANGVWYATGIFGKSRGNPASATSPQKSTPNRP